MFCQRSMTVIGWFSLYSKACLRHLLNCFAFVLPIPSRLSPFPLFISLGLWLTSTSPITSFIAWFFSIRITILRFQHLDIIFSLFLLEESSIHWLSFEQRGALAWLFWILLSFRYRKFSCSLRMFLLLFNRFGTSFESCCRNFLAGLRLRRQIHIRCPPGSLVSSLSWG